MRIAICDDEPVQSAHLATILRGWSRLHAQPLQIERFESAEAFLFAYEADTAWDLLLLDVQMKAMDGIALAKHIRELGGDMPIAFITAFSDYMGEGYEVAALHYLLKPVDAEKLHRVLSRAMVRREVRSLLIDTERGQARVPLPEIVCAEAFAHDVEIRGRNAVYVTRMPIGALYARLEAAEPGAFLRCHRSYIVGLRHVARIERGEVILDGGAAVPLSRRQYEVANRAFIAFYRGETEDMPRPGGQAKDTPRRGEQEGTPHPGGEPKTPTRRADQSPPERLDPTPEPGEGRP